MGGETIRVSVMWFRTKAFIGETCCTGAVRIRVSVMYFGTGAENFAISGAFFVVTSCASSDFQKKVSSESDFRCGDEVISFVLSASGSQKKERSVMSFIHGVTGDETSFIGGAI